MSWSTPEPLESFRRYTCQLGKTVLSITSLLRRGLEALRIRLLPPE